LLSSTGNFAPFRFEIFPHLFRGKPFQNSMHPLPFDRSQLLIKPLAQRDHDLDISTIKDLKPSAPSSLVEKLNPLANKIITARKKGRAIVLMMGAHVIRAGVQRYLIDLMQRGYISCLAMNGAGIIHDYEFARVGATTESVARYIQTGEFGLWKETGELNDILATAYKNNPKEGMGRAVGQAIDASSFPHKDISLFCAAYRLGISATVHVGMGYDIIHEHPNCDGAATGALSYNDFLFYTGALQKLEGGVVMNFGSAIMAPEIYLKALSMCRNIARQNNESIRKFSTLVCDLHDLPEDFTTEPPRNSAAYYFRPWKTMLVRTVADGGESFYVRGNHAETLPALWTCIDNLEKSKR